MPAEAKIAVVSKGDEELLQLHGRESWHFPQTQGGIYAGYHPADSAAAITHLEDLRARGAEYLLFPATAFWWLSHYGDFGRYLGRHRRVYDDSDCIIFDLTSAEDGNGEVGADQAAGAFAGRLPGPSKNERRLPALAAPGEEHAAAAIEAFAKTRLKAFLSTGAKLVFPKVADPLVSVVIPTYQQAHHTYGALESLLACAGELPFELVIVDNASTDETRVLFRQVENVHIVCNEHNAGFGKACNLGAQASRGRYLCFLNNDLLVSPGCLNALVRTIEHSPQCAAVGGKLIHPGGTLQEAGSRDLAGRLNLGLRPWGGPG